MIVTSLTIERRTTVEDTVVRYLNSFTTSMLIKRGGGASKKVFEPKSFLHKVIKKDGRLDLDEQGTVV